jgi:hypothetical protein
MRPKIKIDHYFKEIAKETGVPIEDVVSVYRHYRKSVEQQFKESVIIDLYKFGKFQLSPTWTIRNWERITKVVIHRSLNKTPEELEEDKIYQSYLTLQNRLEDKIEKITNYEKFKVYKERFQEFSRDFRRFYQQLVEGRACGADCSEAIRNLSSLPKKFRQREKRRTQNN